MGIQYPALAEFRRIAEANTAARSKPKPQPSLYSKKPPEFDTNWTNLRVELLKKLWADGLSCSQIATKIGEVTRNAVIGKVHRLGLAGRATTSRKPTRITRPRSIIRTFSATVYARPIGPYKPAQILIPVLEPAPEGAITLANINELTDTMCHWPIGDPQDQRFHYCARRKSRDASFCEHHMAIAYQRGPRKPKPKGKNGFYWIDLAGRNAR